MLKALNAVNTLLGTVLALVIVGALSVGGWYGYSTYNEERWARQESEKKLEEQTAEIADLGKQVKSGEEKISRLTSDLETSKEQIVSLNKELEQKQKEIQRLDTSLRLMKVDRRVARVDVLSQKGSAKTGDLKTEFSFVELGADGEPIDKPRVFSIEGDVVYFDAWVVKFGDEFVEAGDPLRAASVCLFRRIFGEAQQPRDGFVLDAEGAQPAAYRAGKETSDFEREVWARFWDYANNPETAKEAGVRAAHGEAPSIKLRPGNRYKVQLRASGGLTIVPEEVPASKPPAM